MKSYKLNKTLENSTYPIEQELKKVNRSTQNSTLKTIITLSTVIFSGMATSFIYENKIFYCEIYNLITKFNIKLTVSQFFLIFLIAIYLLCVIVSIILNCYAKKKEQPRNMKKNPHGRKKLSKDFHKSIINDIVVGLSFLDKTDENIEPDIRNMYLYEATYYFIQAEDQIEEMEIFDDTSQAYNKELIDEIGYATLFTTLEVFQNGVKKVMNKMPQSKEEFVEYEALENIYENLKIHINLLEDKKYKEKKSWIKRN